MALIPLNVMLSFWESMTTTHLVPLHLSTLDLRRILADEGKTSVHRDFTITH
jgi:hypothetical protein